MEKTPTTKSTDENWSLHPTISHLSGYQEHKTKLLAAFSDWLHYKMMDKPQSRCSQPPIWTDQYSTQEAKHHTSTKQPQAQILQILPPIKGTVTPDLTTAETTQDIMPKPLTADRHEALLQMQRQIPFVNASPDDCQIAKHHNTEQIYLHR